MENPGSTSINIDENSGVFMQNPKYKKCGICHRVLHRRAFHKHSLECYGGENRPTTSDEQVSIVHVDVGMLHANCQHAASE